MVGAVVGNGAHSVGELPGNEETALATNLHAAKALVEAGNEAPHTLGKGHGLRGTHFGLAVFAEDRFAVFVLLGLTGMVEGGVELDAVGGAVSGVMNLVHFAWLGVGAGADLDVLITQGECALDDATSRGYAGRKLDAGGGRGRGGGFGCGGCRLGGSDSGFRGRLCVCSYGGCRDKEKQNWLFHCDGRLHLLLLGSLTGDAGKRESEVSRNCRRGNGRRTANPYASLCELEIE